jgi:hypothetical protein
MLFKVGSVTAILGAVSLFIGVALHPHPDPGNAPVAFAEYAADRLWVTSHLIEFLGVSLMVVALFALTRSLADEPVAWIADLAFATALVALAVAAVLQAVDGIALKVMVDRWMSVAEPQKQTAFEAAFAVRQIEIGLASYTPMLLGTTALLFGIALAASAAYPAWLGWIAIVGGTGTAVGGLLTAYSGFSGANMNISMPFNLVLTVWVAVAGVVMWRRAP